MSRIHQYSEEYHDPRIRELLKQYFDCNKLINKAHRKIIGEAISLRAHELTIDQCMKLNIAFIKSPYDHESTLKHAVKIRTLSAVQQNVNQYCAPKLSPECILNDKSYLIHKDAMEVQLNISFTISIPSYIQHLLLEYNQLDSLKISQFKSVISNPKITTISLDNDKFTTLNYQNFGKFIETYSLKLKRLFLANNPFISNTTLDLKQINLSMIEVLSIDGCEGSICNLHIILGLRLIISSTLRAIIHIARNQIPLRVICEADCE